MMTTVSVSSGQVPLETIQTKVLMPMERPVTAEVGWVGVVGVPVPLSRVQVPVPVVGVVAAKVLVVEQMVWSGPALAGLGGASIVMATVSEVVGQTPLLIVQMKVFVPIPRPVIAVLNWVELVIHPVPVSKVQVPMAGVGSLPARVVVFAQRV